MNIKFLNKYLELCNELKKSPSIEGLKLFRMAFES